MKIECEVQDVDFLLSRFQDVVRQKVEAETEHSYTKEKVRRLSDSVDDLNHQLGPDRINITQAEIQNLIRGIASANKIQAIKSIRSLLGLGLKEAKDMVEEFTAYGEADRSARLGFSPAQSKTVDVPLTRNADEQGTEGTWR